MDPGKSGSFDSNPGSLLVMVRCIGRGMLSLRWEAIVDRPCHTFCTSAQRNLPPS